MQNHKVYKTIPFGYIKFLSRIDIFLNPLVSRFVKLVSWINKNTIKHPVIHAISQPVNFGDIAKARASNSSKFPDLNVFSPIISKDFDLIDDFIKQLRRHSVNNISSIFLITRKSDYELLVNLTRKYSEVEVLLEEQIVPKTVLKELSKFQNPLKGWILQMAIKFSATMISSEEFNLIIDPDTILTSDILWVDSDGKSALFPTYHDANINLRVYESFQKLNISTNRFECFVSHMMVWRKSIVKIMLERINDSNSSPNTAQTSTYETALLLLFKIGSEVVDWQLYGDFVLSNFPSIVVRNKWGNLAIYDPMLDSEAISRYINKYSQHYRSLSFHTHSLIHLEESRVN